MINVFLVILITILLVGGAVCWAWDIGKQVYRFYKREQRIGQESHKASARELRKMRVHRRIKPRDYTPMEYKVTNDEPVQHVVDRDFLESCAEYQHMQSAAPKRPV